MVIRRRGVGFGDSVLGWGGTCAQVPKCEGPGTPGFVVERFERCAGTVGVAGPSTALCSAQDDKFVGGEGERSSFARYPTLCKERKG